MMKQNLATSTGAIFRWDVVAVLGVALCFLVLPGSGCDDDNREKAAAEAQARAAQSEQVAQLERSKREQAELSVRKAEDGRAFWLAAAFIGTVVAFVIGAGMPSKARADLQKQRNEGNGQYAATDRLREHV